MLTVFKYIRDFYQKEFNFYYFLLVMLLVGMLIYFNYWHALEQHYILTTQSEFHIFFGYYFLYLIAFSGAFLLQPLFLDQCTYFKKPWFWVILFLAPAFFAFRVNFNLHQPLIKKIWAGDAQEFWLHGMNWIVRVFVVLIPVFIIWLIKDKNNQPFYGAKKLNRVRPYLIMLLIMVPLIALAATQKDFLAMYPKAKIIDQLNLSSKSLHYLVYELCYGFDFVSIEFFFRGFLILALAKICGPRCIIPVACFYCAIHFGKPLGEAISSFWGGIFLGIISYNSRSIWGGLIIHLGIAWLMEAASWLSLFIKNY